MILSSNRCLLQPGSALANPFSLFYPVFVVRIGLYPLLDVRPTLLAGLVMIGFESLLPLTSSALCNCPAAYLDACCQESISSPDTSNCWRSSGYPHYRSSTEDLLIACRNAYQRNHGKSKVDADFYGGLPSFQTDSTALALLSTVPQQSEILTPTEVFESSPNARTEPAISMACLTKEMLIVLWDGTQLEILSQTYSHQSNTQPTRPIALRIDR